MMAVKLPTRRSICTIISCGIERHGLASVKGDAWELCEQLLPEPKPAEMEQRRAESSSYRDVCLFAQDMPERWNVDDGKPLDLVEAEEVVIG
jgi:hypothetical protein